MIVQNGERLVVPMRYQCRIAGVPASFDEKYPGTYNARLDSLEGYWRNLFGRSHGVAVATRFYEHVERLDDEGRRRNEVLEFRPQDGREMLVACLWSRWTDEDTDEELLSFAAITTDPPPEVIAAGHDRCIIPIRSEHLDAWLSPEGRSLGELYAILEDRDRPYYEHTVAD